MHVLMIDDHVMFLQALKSLLNMLAPDMVIDAASNADTAVEMASAQRHDLVLLDWHLEEANESAAVDTIARLRDVGCVARIVVFSGDTGASLIRTAIDRGAAGFIPKKYSSELMLSALDVVLKGGIFLPAEAVATPIAPQAGAGRSPDDAAELQRRLAELTPRQLDAYRAAARGLPNKLIARELGVAESTVKTHLAAVYSVLGVHNRTQAAYQASRGGIRVG